jgi:signal peptidase II
MVVILDQWTKHLVQVSLPLNGTSTPVIPGFLYLTYVQNLGSAFGQLQGAGPLLVLVALVAVAGILFYRTRLLRADAPPHPLLVWGLALPLGGAIGNSIDRTILGHVVDFLALRQSAMQEPIWPIFNVADSAISLGALALALFFLFVSKPEAHTEGLAERHSQPRECGTEHRA